MSTTTTPCTTTHWTTDLMERDLLPDWIIRAGIRRLLSQTLREQDKGSPEAQQAYVMQRVAELKASPIAIATDAANRQHYELPPRFFQICLGPHLKYSSGYWPQGVESLGASEQAMLHLTIERARLADGQRILELGCGWGSLTLEMARRFPNSQIVGVSNSAPQREFILARAAQRGLANLQIITANMTEFQAPGLFDRVVSVEMFEHMRNYELLLAKVASWMHPNALLFVHIFTHRRHTYPYEVRSASDWMAEHFFTGGIMPSHDLLLYFQQDVRIVEHWALSGTHYQRTSEAWLANMDAHTPEISELFRQTYGVDGAGNPLTADRIELESERWRVRWRVFFMACAELWGFGCGDEWLVSHYLFSKQ